MTSWIFWYVYGTVAYTILSGLFIFINWFPIKIHYELWRGRKFIAIWKRGRIITDWRILLNEPKLGLKRDTRTYKIDDRKGLRFKRLPVHIFDEDNIAELDFSDKEKLYPPNQFDPEVYTSTIRRALASGVNDFDWKPYIYLGLVILLGIGICALCAVYFGYNNYTMLHDYLIKTGVIKV